MAALLLAMACKLPASAPSDDHSQDTPTEAAVDADQDGYDAEVDCNDADASVNPGAEETCGNGQDDNCDGSGDGCPWEGESALEGWELSGSEPDERFGSTLAVCDADGDGQQDLVVSSAGTNADAGAVHVFYGPFGEDTAVPRVWTILGAGPSTTFGSALDCQSDMTGDDAADLLIGAPDETGKSGGAMYVVAGGGTGVTPIAGAYVSAWTGAYYADRFGYSVLAIDTDGDDADEIAVTSLGAPGYETQFGATYVVTSFPGTHPVFVWDNYVFGTVDRALLGTAGNPGDTDGDGIDELAVTAELVGYPWDIVLLYQQPIVGALATDDADVQIEGNARFVARNAQLGHADLNGDGRDDLLIGNANDSENAGGVSVFYEVGVDHWVASDADVELEGRKHSGAGITFASPGDLDGDGSEELLIGASAGGGVYLQHGGVESGVYSLDESAQASWWHADAASDAGIALGAGSLTDDLLSDFVIGAPLADDENRGAVVLIPSLDL